ncbi:MAG: TIR domain-containing protein [Blastocatellia bacterium]
MKAFLSWSGDSSKKVALVLRDWLKLVFPEVALWMSDLDIQAGQRWGDQLDRQLEATDFGILCLVRSNLRAPWLLFEAGALSKSVDSSRVVPYCVGLRPEDVQGPLSRFQSVSADETGTRKLVESINALLENKRSERDLGRIYEKWWPDLQTDLESIPAAYVRGPSHVNVERILCAATPQFEELGADDDMEVLNANYPNAVIRLRGIGFKDLRDVLTRENFQIIHLLGYVDAKSGDFIFGDDERLPAGALLKLLERTRTELIFLATCDSLTLGAILSRNMSVIAASDAVEAAKMVRWAKCFYGLLAQGSSLAASYDFAQAAVDVPIRLLIRNDCLLLPVTSAPGERLTTT